MRIQELFPDQCIDADADGEEALVRAAGMAEKNSVPVLLSGPAFVFRFCDRIIHTVCRRNLHVVFAVSRESIRADSDRMQLEVCTLSFLSLLPGLAVMCPKNGQELEDMLVYAVREHDGPVALCYEKEMACDGLEGFRAPVCFGTSEVLYDEKGIALLAAGSMVQYALQVRRRLRDMGYSCSLVNMRFIRPLDEQILRKAAADHMLVVTMEENVRSGGMGDRVLEYYNDICAGVQVINAALPDKCPGQDGALPAGDETGAAGTDMDLILEQIISRYVGMCCR